MNQRQVFETRLERYCRLKRLSPLTFKKHSFNLAVFCNWLGRKEFNKLNCQNFIIFLQDKGWKVNSINSAISTLKVLTQQLADNGDIEEDFSHKLKVLRQDPFSPILLTQNEVFAIINCPRVWGKYHKYIDRRKYDLYFELLACCALRRAEVLNLRVRDFDFTSNTFRILGKGRKVRTLPIPKLMREKLKIWVMEKGDYDNFIFSGSKGGRMGISTFRDELKKRVEILGIKKKVTFHLFRHSWCTEGVKAGLPPEIIMKAMGHSSFQSHLRYTGLVGEDLRKDMNKHPFNNPKTRKQLEERFAKLVSSEKQEVKQN